jgi:hypothetical protein
VVAVHLPWAYVQRRFIAERLAPMRCHGDVIRRYHEEHAQARLTAALDGEAIESVLQSCLCQPG